MKTRIKKVWRIFRFQERFELADDSRSCRKGPLLFVREYVGSGQDDEAINYKRQVSACRARENWRVLVTVFLDLREIAANYSRCYRGYLLDERFEPANINKIAEWIFLDVKEACKVLKELEQIGLIEKVSMPKFDLTRNKPPEDNENNGVKNTNFRKFPEKSGKIRKPFKKRKGKSEGKEKKKKTGKPEGKAKAKSNPKAQSAKATAGQEQGQANPNPNRNPKDNPKDNPTESDGRVGSSKQEIHRDPPRQSFKPFKPPGQLGVVLQKLYNPAAEEFAKSVYSAIGTPYPQTTKEGHSELACWKIAWAKAQIAGITPQGLSSLWGRTMKEAVRLKAKRQRKQVKWHKSPEAVLRWLFDRFMKNAERAAEYANNAEPACAMGVG